MEKKHSGIGRFGKFYSVYQPIVDVKRRSVFGYEALIRGSGDWRNPMEMFREAYEKGFLIDWDFECLRSAVRILPKLGRNQKLFLNVEPSTLIRAFAAGERGDRFLKKIAPYGRSIVFELTEGMKARDFHLIRQGVLRLRRQGCGFAVDDIGGIGAKLLNLLTLKPDFIKLDMSLVKDYHKGRLQYALIKQLVSLGRRTGSAFVAEGIEFPRDLKFIREFRIPYAQGFYFAHPKRALQTSLPALKSMS